MLSGWFQDPDFVDAKGKPRLLDLAGDRGFEGLAKRYGARYPEHGAARRSWSRSARSRPLRQGRSRAEDAPDYSPAAPDDEARLRSGQRAEDLGATVAENLMRAEAAHAPRGARDEREIARGARREFHDYIESRGMASLEDIDRWLLSA